MLPLYILDPKGPMSVPQALLVAAVGIVVVLAELALLALFITVLSKIFKAVLKNKKEQPAETPAVAVAAPAAVHGTPLPENQSEGSVDLINVDEPTAACIMAIVSNESGIPLNRLRFRSIKLLEDK